MHSVIVSSALCAFFIISLVAGGNVPMKDCGSPGGRVHSVTLDPAPRGTCTFPRGKDVTVSIDLTTNEVTSSLKTVVKGDVVVWMPFELPNNDACTQGVSCPTTAGARTTVQVTVPIPAEFPIGMRFVTEVSFVDDMGEKAICVQIPAETC